MSPLHRVLRSTGRYSARTGVMSVLKLRRAHELHSQLSRGGVNHTFVALALGALLLSSYLSAVGAVDVDSLLNARTSEEIKQARDKISDLRARAQMMIEELEVRTPRTPARGNQRRLEEVEPRNRTLDRLLVMKDALGGHERKAMAHFGVRPELD